MSNFPDSPRFDFLAIYAILYGAGVALIGVAIPLYRGRIPPNSLYGARFASTLTHDRVWYQINARGGRDLIIIGSVYLAAVTFTLLFGASWPFLLRIFCPLALLFVGVLLDAVVLSRAASKLAQSGAELGERLPNER